MSRAPIEECLELFPNRFELCSIASKRARQLARGAPTELPAGDHKATVQSLMEIARGQIGRAVLAESDPPPLDTRTSALDALDPFAEG